MPQTHLDCKNLACPGPVLKCKQLIDSKQPDCLSVTVDNEAAKENVSRFLKNQGYSTVTKSAGNGLWTITGTRPVSAAGEKQRACTQCESMSSENLARLGHKTVVFITADTIGRGDEALGGKLMKNFLATLPELGQDLWRVILVNGGVRLTVQDSPVLSELKRIEDSGVTILVCGTCLDFFGLLDRKAVGETTNMLDVVTSLQMAGKVIQV